MDILATVFTSKLLIFALAISGIMFFIRTIAEYAISRLKTSKIYNELLLPLLPLMLGVVFGSLAGIGAPGGLVAGMFSGLTFKVIKGLLKKSIGDVSNG